MGLYSGGLIIGRIFASEIWGTYFREGLSLGGGGGGLIIGILRYVWWARLGSQNPSVCVRLQKHTHHSDKFKQFYNSRVKQIVSLSIFLKRRNNWIKQLALDNVTVVELIL